MIWQKKKLPTRKKATMAETKIVLNAGILPLLMPIIILVAIYSGIFTPTEAAAVCVI